MDVHSTEMDVHSIDTFFFFLLLFSEIVSEYESAAEETRDPATVWMLNKSSFDFCLSLTC